MKITKRQLRRIIKESKGWFLLGLDGTLAKSQKTRTPIWWSNEAGAQQAYDSGYGGEGAVPVEILLAPDMYAYNGSDADPADLESVRQRWAPGTLNKVPSELGESKMKITKRQLRGIIREAITTYEQEIGEPSEFVESNWVSWLDERGLGVEDLDDLAHYVGAQDRSWLNAKPPANGMMGPADIEQWAEDRAVDKMYAKRSKDPGDDGFEPGQEYAGIS